MGDGPHEVRPALVSVRWGGLGGLVKCGGLRSEGGGIGFAAVGWSGLSGGGVEDGGLREWDGLSRDRVVARVPLDRCTLCRIIRLPGLTVPLSTRPLPPLRLMPAYHDVPLVLPVVSHPQDPRMHSRLTRNEIPDKREDTSLGRRYRHRRRPLARARGGLAVSMSLEDRPGGGDVCVTGDVVFCAGHYADLLMSGDDLAGLAGPLEGAGLQDLEGDGAAGAGAGAAAGVVHGDSAAHDFR